MSEIVSGRSHHTHEAIHGEVVAADGAGGWAVGKPLRASRLSAATVPSDRAQAGPYIHLHSRVRGWAAIPGPFVCTEGLGLKGQLKLGPGQLGCVQRPRPSLLGSYIQLARSWWSSAAPDTEQPVGWGSTTTGQRHFSQ